MNPYEGKSILVTGHTGFKGTWLKRKLIELDAKVWGYALPENDVRDAFKLWDAVRAARPDIIFHLAAQAFVPVGYEMPLMTFETNVLGTANLLEAVRRMNRPCAVVVVTTDKCYLPSAETFHREDHPLGGRCPYSASKASAEHVVEAYRSGFFAPKNEISVATARAGNVIGGGDFGTGRLIPNAVKALRAEKPIPVWNPSAVRPWQYIEDVIDGYLRLGEMLMSRPHLYNFCSAWNFGPDHHHTVREVVESVIDAWGSGTWEHQKIDLRETSELRIDSTKARNVLGWKPRWSFEDMIRETIEWYRSNQA